MDWRISFSRIRNVLSASIFKQGPAKQSGQETKQNQYFLYMIYFCSNNWNYMTFYENRGILPLGKIFYLNINLLK